MLDRRCITKKSNRAISPRGSSSSSRTLKTILPKNDSTGYQELLDTFKTMDPETQFEVWKGMIDNNPLSIEQLTFLRSAIDERIRLDIISSVPYEIALYIMSFLSGEDLCKAAQTCRSWRNVCENNRLWREKCKEEGLLDDEHTLEVLFKKRIKNSHAKQNCIANQTPPEEKLCRSEWKINYLKHVDILRNWRSREFEISKPSKSPKATHDTSSIDLTTRSHLMQMRCHDEQVITCLQYNPRTSTIVTGSDDATLRVWSSETGRFLATLKGHEGGVWSSQLSPDDIVISGSTDRTLKVWKAHTGALIHTLYGHSSTVRCLALDKNFVVSGSRDTTLRLWDIVKGVCAHVFTGHTAAVRCVEFKNNTIISGAYDFQVRVWDALNGTCRYALEAHTQKVYSLQFDGKTIASGSLDSTICIWDATTGKLCHSLKGHTSLTSKMQLKGNLLVSANADSLCKVWNINTGKCLHTLEGDHKHKSAITSVYFNNRHVVTSSDDGTVKLWDIRSGEFIRDLIVLPTASNGGVVWRIRASYTKLICAVGSRSESQTEDTHLLVLDFDD